MRKLPVLPRRKRDRALRDLQGADRNEIVAAAKLLSTDPSLAPTMLKLLRREKRVEVRQGLLYALSWQGDLRAWYPLIRVLANRSEAPSVRGHAAEGLAYMFSRKRKGSQGFKEALRVLVAALKDPSSEVRYYALFALGSSGDRAVLPVLRKMTRDHETSLRFVGTVGEEAQDAIANIQRLSPPESPTRRSMRSN